MTPGRRWWAQDLISSGAPGFASEPVPFVDTAVLRAPDGEDLDAPEAMLCTTARDYRDVYAQQTAKPGATPG